MILDHFSKLLARRTRGGVEIVDLASLIPPLVGSPTIRLVPPEGHHIIAVELEQPHRYITSDGETLWVCCEHPPRGAVSIVATAQEAGVRDMERVRQEIGDCARRPLGPLQHARFIQTMPHPQHGAREARWPTVVFGSGGDRLVAAQLDYLGAWESEQPVFRDVVVSPFHGSSDEFGIREAEIHALAFGLGDDPHAIIRDADGKAWVGVPGAFGSAFDAAYPLLVRVDVPEHIVAAALLFRAPGCLVYACAGSSEVFIGHVVRRALAASMKIQAPVDAERVPLAANERLFGVTARGEALVLVENRIEARTAAHTSLLVEAEGPIVEAAGSRCAVVFRVEDGGLGVRFI